VRDRLNAARQSWAQWRSAPQRLSLLRTAYAHLSPVLAQLIMSSYIFMFNLPFRTAKWLPGLALHLVRWTVINGHYRARTTPSPSDFASSMAACLGPSVNECSSRLPDGSSYGQSVLDRSQTRPIGDWDGRIRLYREGLATGQWKANEMTSRFLLNEEESDHRANLKEGIPSQQMQQATTPPPDSFQCPVTIIYGLQDLALDPRITLDGMERYFAPPREDGSAQSHIVRVRDCGHWSLIERTGVEVLEATLLWKTKCMDDDSACDISSVPSGRGLESWLGDIVDGQGIQISTGRMKDW